MESNQKDPGALPPNSAGSGCFMNMGVELLSGWLILPHFSVKLIDLVDVLSQGLRFVSLYDPFSCKYLDPISAPLATSNDALKFSGGASNTIGSFR